MFLVSKFIEKVVFVEVKSCFIYEKILRKLQEKRKPDNHTQFSFKKMLRRMQLIIVIELLLQNLILKQNVREWRSVAEKFNIVKVNRKR